LIKHATDIILDSVAKVGPDNHLDKYIELFHLIYVLIVMHLLCYHVIKAF